MFYFTKGKERERKIYNADADAEISKWPYVNIRKFRPQAKKKKKNGFPIKKTCISML